MNKTIIAKDVGFMVIDDYPDGTSKIYIEEDVGSNCYGDVGYFYRDSSEDIPNGGICYVAEVEGKVISFDDPQFKDHAYTYDDVLRICEGLVSAAKQCLEVADGCHIEFLWNDIQEAYRPDNHEEEWD